MIDPIDCVAQILLNAPSENAVPLANLMAWMAEQADLKKNGEFVKALELPLSIIRSDRQEREADAQGSGADLPCADSAGSN